MPAGAPAPLSTKKLRPENKGGAWLMVGSYLVADPILAGACALV